jgi:hypothetical protein
MLSRLSYFGTQMFKSPFLWYLFVVEEPNNQYLHAVQEPVTQLLSKLQLYLCLDFVQDSVILVLRFQRAPFFGTYLLAKNQTISIYMLSKNQVLSCYPSYSYICV